MSAIYLSEELQIWLNSQCTLSASGNSRLECMTKKSPLHTLKIYMLILAKPDNGSMYWCSSMSSLQLWSASAVQPHITDIIILHKLLSYYITNYINHWCNSSDLQLCNLIYVGYSFHGQFWEGISKNQSQSNFYYIDKCSTYR